MKVENRTAAGVFVLVVVLIMTFLLRDASSLASSPVYEIVGHAGASAGFTLSTSGLLLLRRGAQPRLGAVFLGGAALTVVGEVGQYLNPTRYVELGDVLTGLAGVIIAAFGLRVISEPFDDSRLLRLHVMLSVVALGVLVVFLFTSAE